MVAYSCAVSLAGERPGCHSRHSIMFLAIGGNSEENAGGYARRLVGH